MEHIRKFVQFAKDPEFEEWLGLEVQGMLACDDCGPRDLGRCIIHSTIIDSADGMFHAFTSFPLSEIVERWETLQKERKQHA